jgi:dihydrolipoamide dehydrogenase
MSSEAKDLIVLGAGPGGYVAAIRAAQLGRKVTIIEREALGGVCLNWGCIPSKALLRSAQVYNDFKHASDFGFESGPIKVDFPKIIQRSREVSSRLSQGVSFLMKKNKIEVLMGNASFERKGSLTLKQNNGPTTLLSYKDIIIGTGARPRVIPGIEVDGDVIHTYRTALEYKRLPQRILVIGAGAIGMEFAFFYHSLGAQVTVCEMLDQVLPLEDREVAETLQKSFEKKGMIVKTKSAVSDIKKAGKSVNATINSTSLDGKVSEEKWSGDALLVAIGVVPNTENIGLETIGLKLSERKFITVDSFMRTNLDHHFAIGDCVGAILLAHVASHQGIVAAEAACGTAHHPMRYDNIPSCTYCQPQVASVGMNEKTLKEKGIKYRVGKIPFSAIGKAIAIGEQEGFIKVLIDDSVGEVLGVHIIHSEATELIAEAGIIRSHEGIAASVVDTVHAHPTLSESMAEAMALALGRPINF